MALGAKASALTATGDWVSGEQARLSIGGGFRGNFRVRTVMENLEKSWNF